MAESEINDRPIIGKRGRPLKFAVIRQCSYCGADIVRSPSHYSDGTTGPLAGLVFCNRDCQKRNFRGSVKCSWPNCGTERLVEGGNFRRAKNKGFFCEPHTSELEAATGSRIVTQKRLEWLADKPIGHRHVTAKFYRWSVFKLGDGKCAICTAPLSFGPEFHLDHATPIFDGGETRLSNMQALCLTCHKEKSRTEQKKVNARRWNNSGLHLRAMTHLEKDRLISKLRARLAELGADI